MNTENNNKKHSSAEESIVEDPLREIKNTIIRTADSIIKTTQTTIEKYLEGKSSEIDTYIRNIEKEERDYRFITGEISIVYDTPDLLHIEVDLYFQDQRKKWIKKSILGKKIKIEWILLEEDKNKLISSKRISFEYNH